MEKVYTVEDVQNILKQEQEKWAAMSKVDIVYSVHGRDKILYNILKYVQGNNGVAIQIEV